jgi:hypothetical protein
LEPIKDENYNLGGINVKASVYITGENQVLDLRNYSFERPGGHKSRPGISDFVTLPKSTYGSTPTSLFQWTSRNYIKSSNGSGSSSVAGASFLAFDSGNNLHLYNSATTTVIEPSLVPGALDFVSETTDQYTGNLKDFLYFANGSQFKIYSTGFPTLFGTWPYSNAIEYRFPVAPTIFGLSFGTGVVNPSISPYPSGTHTFEVLLGKPFAGTVNTPEMGNYWFYSEPSRPAYFHLGATQASGEDFHFRVQFQYPTGYGYVRPLVKYTSPLGGVAYYMTPAMALTTSDETLDATLLSGGTGIISFYQFSSAANVSGIPDFSLTPRFIESYKNMLFMSGFSTEPHQVRFSDVGTFLFSDAANVINVLPGQSKEMTNLIKFQDTLVLFKDTSVYEISGDSPETLSVKTITVDYGCVNNRAAVTFKNKLWFVDKKGICEYNGPDTFIVSYPVQTFFDALTVNNFRAMYVKSQNQVWFSSDDVVLVYDCDVDKWTIYDRIPINASAASEVIEFGTSQPQPSWITSGTSHFFFSKLDPTVSTDRGQAITLMMKSRYHKRLGETTEEMWRRVFMDIAPGNTTTPTMTINLLPDYGSSVAVTKYVNVGQFQSRVDFGFPARSMAVQTILQTSETVTINGYTIESRYLRSV